MPNKPKWFAEHRRVLWFWCPGHRQYEITCVERMVGSEEFERRLLDHWGGDVPYRITFEGRDFQTAGYPWQHKEGWEAR